MKKKKSEAVIESGIFDLIYQMLFYNPRSIWNPNSYKLLRIAKFLPFCIFKSWKKKKKESVKTLNLMEIIWNKYILTLTSFQWYSLLFETGYILLRELKPAFDKSEWNLETVIEEEIHWMVFFIFF